MIMIAMKLSKSGFDEKIFIKVCRKFFNQNPVAKSKTDPYHVNRNVHDEYGVTESVFQPRSG